MILLLHQQRKVFGLCLFLFLLLPSLTSASMERDMQLETTKRIEMNINDGWKFYKGVQGLGRKFSSVNFNDDNWELVRLPHTWNAEDGTDGGNDYYQGECWYRKTVNIPTSLKGKSLYLQFDAANKDAEVFVNGQSISNHMGGYTSFTVDITKDVKIGKNNVIAVRVNNERDDSIPLSGDFTFYGGLYRGVRLTATEKIHIDLQDDGSKGIYVRIPNTKSIKKEVNVTVAVPVRMNHAENEKNLSVNVVMKDAEGKIITYKKLKSFTFFNDRLMYKGTLKVKHPHLWNGTKDPYLYTMEATVAKKGEDIDRVIDKVGFRYYSIDPNKGFFLNGKRYPLHGAAIHQDRKGFGSAVPDQIRAEDFKIMEEMGVNALRTAHYPHSQFVYRQADERGWIVWAEIPFVNEMNRTAAFADNTEQQLTEMIKQNYNHPSIVTWGLQNELGAFGGYLPGSKLPVDVQYQKATKLMQRLAKQVKKLDPERMTAQAIMGVPEAKGFPLTPEVDHQLDWGSDQVIKGKNDIKKFIDISSLNYYFGWYTPNIKDFSSALELIHSNYQDALIGISEYGAGANPFQHQLIRPDFQWSSLKALGQWHPEEYQSNFHEVSYEILEKHRELWSTFIWNMFDFGSDGRNEAGMPGINDKGLVTFDRKIKKDAFFFYKAQWNKTDPFVYITSRRFTLRHEKKTMVKVYSNLKKVTLTVNGNEYGPGRLQQNGVFVWDNVELKNGINLVTAAAKKEDGTSVIDQVPNWTVTNHP